MPSPYSKNRFDLERRFQEGDIPEEKHFKQLIHSGINQEEDGIQKGQSTPLMIKKPPSSGEVDHVIQFHANLNDQPAWGIGMANIEDTSSQGFTVSNRDGNDLDRVRLFIKDNGQIGIGTTNPSAKLQVAGDILATKIQAFLQPTNGIGNEQGIAFAETVNSGQGARIQYSADAKTLELALKDADGKLVLTSHRIGIGTHNPQAKLDVKGGIALSESISIPGDQKLSFSNLDNPLKISFGNGQGLGNRGDQLHYSANQTHSWGEANSENEWMSLHEEGLTVMGSGSYQGNLTVAGSGNYTGDLEVRGKLQIAQQVVATGDMSIPGNKKIQFIDANSPVGESLKIQLWTNQGFGGTDKTITYIAKDTHSWETADGSQVHMKLEANTGALTVRGGATFGEGISASGDAHVGGSLAIGKAAPDANFQMDVAGSLQLNGDLQLKSAGQIRFPLNSDSTSLLIQLRDGFGMGTTRSALFYTGSGYVWKDVTGSLDRMSLSTQAGGGLTVHGTGTSSFNGDLAIKGNSTVAGTMAIGATNVRAGFKLDVAGNVKGEKFEAIGSNPVIKAGNTQISNGKIKIGNTEIGESELGILKKLASNSLQVQIISRNGYVLENYKDRKGDGDAMRSIQFKENSNQAWGKMKLVIW